MRVVLGSVGGEVLPPRPEDLDEACEGLRSGCPEGEDPRREPSEGLCASELAPEARGGEGAGTPTVDPGGLGVGGGRYTLGLEVTTKPELLGEPE